MKGTPPRSVRGCFTLSSSRRGVSRRAQRSSEDVQITKEHVQTTEDYVQITQEQCGRTNRTRAARQRDEFERKNLTRVGRSYMQPSMSAPDGSRFDYREAF